MTHIKKISISKFKRGDVEKYKVTVYEDGYPIESLHYDTAEQATDAATATAMQYNVRAVQHNY